MSFIKGENALSCLYAPWLAQCVRLRHWFSCPSTFLQMSLSVLELRGTINPWYIGFPSQIDKSFKTYELHPSRFSVFVFRQRCPSCSSCSSLELPVLQQGQRVEVITCASNRPDESVVRLLRYFIGVTAPPVHSATPSGSTCQLVRDGSIL